MLPRLLLMLLPIPFVLAACYGAVGSTPVPSVDVATPIPTPLETPGRAGISVLDLHVKTPSCPDIDRRVAVRLDNGPAFWVAFPSALKAPELDGTTIPLIAIVYQHGWPGLLLGKPGSGPRPTQAPGHYDICVETADGSDGTGGVGGFGGIVGQSMLVYGDVDGTGSIVPAP